jgi:hypothetical protein
MATTQENIVGNNPCEHVRKKISLSSAALALIAVIIGAAVVLVGLRTAQRQSWTGTMSSVLMDHRVADIDMAAPQSRVDYELAEEMIHSTDRTLEVDDLVKIKYSAQYFTEHLQNKRVVLIGDSLTRYQYLSLVYSLSTGHFLNTSLMPNPVVERSWPSWHEFYARTNEMFQPFEYCDCFRDAVRTLQQNENRFYFDNVRNISIVYLSVVGTDHCFGHWSDWGKRRLVCMPEFLP